MRSVIAHYQEIALKGKNRPWFLRRLVHHLEVALADLDIQDVRVPMGRIEIQLGAAADSSEVRERLGRVFGLANFAVAGRATLDVEDIAASILRDLPHEPAESFRILVRRADKRFPIPSPVLERELGRRVQESRGWPVRLKNPALVIWVELLPEEAFYYFGKEPGPGGMPTGTSGRLAVLLSGGIDSPVAAWRMMRRGCKAAFIHFHSYPFLSVTSQDKARELVRLLTRYQLQSQLHLVPFGELQRQVTLSVPGPMRVVVYRRLMLRIAEAMAKTTKARALVTGEVVGQVASQTVENMTVIAQATSLEVLRPLVGMDKEEITAQAQRIGTYPISIVPDEDCCTLFTPRHPLTRARLQDVLAAEASLPIGEMVQSALDRTVVERFTYPVVESEVLTGPAEAGCHSF
jgi:tRNA uracil 4-sulfurtransferase